MHTRASHMCSGVLIAPGLVLTAMHCVFDRDGAVPAPLSSDGFVVGFGPSHDVRVHRNVEHVVWAGMADGTSFDALVASGADAALLRLSRTAPANEIERGVDLDTRPANAQPVVVAGYGLNDLARGTHGERTAAAGRITGFDPAAGIIQVDGAAACLGDSGGPVLTADLSSVLGVISQIAGGPDSCDRARSFAVTPRNPAVRQLIATGCASAGGCGPSDAEDAGAADDAGP